MLIRTIESGDVLYGKRIGIEGKESFVYASFDRLDQLAADSLWVKLSYSLKPVMRAYAYKALKSRNKSLALDVANRLKTDTSKIIWVNGDISITCSINYYITIK